jgi:hypothetical protein
MNAVGLKAEMALKAFLEGLSWGDVDVTVLTSFDRGSQSYANPEEPDGMPSLPYIVVRCEDSTQTHSQIDVHECSMAIDLRTQADDEQPTEMFTLLQIMEEGLQSLCYGDGWDDLSIAVSGTTPGFDCQYAQPGSFSGMRPEDRTRVFTRSLTVWGRTVKPS